ncbi:dihydrodipicolinate synthase family protein [Sinomonas sp. P47F7]|uniref:dihydrodipicolinate synthase family protein n=1 Tax=Sinomonas sp. P47F7 TaxID=3410987 RepID=UPI003BF544FE
MVTPTLPRGAMVALVTPTTPAGEVDPGALDRLVGHVVAGGVAGISPCGSTGEGVRLTSEQRLDVTARVVERSSGLPVIAGVPMLALPDAEGELADLGSLGATAALVAPPGYFPMSDAEVENLYLRLADASPVPLVLYNIPAFTRIPLSVHVVARLARHENIVGLKDSSRDLEYLQSLVAAIGDDEVIDFRIYTGTDTMLVASALAGADGSIAASANLVPDLGVQILNLVSTDLRRAIELQRRLSAIVASCRRGTPPAGWKAALSLLGLCDPAPVPPALPLAADAMERLRYEMREAAVLGSTEARASG